MIRSSIIFTQTPLNTSDPKSPTQNHQIQAPQTNENPQLRTFRPYKLQRDGPAKGRRCQCWIVQERLIGSEMAQLRTHQDNSRGWMIPRQRI